MRHDTEQRTKKDKDGEIHLAAVDTARSAEAAPQLSHAAPAYVPYLEISWRELINPKVNWLLMCFHQFRRLSPPAMYGEGSNLVMMWRRDLDDLIASAKKASNATASGSVPSAAQKS